MAGIADNRNYFLIVANMRCGTTMLQMMMDELPDVATDFEFKWAPSYEAHPQHMIIPHGNFSCTAALDTISDSKKVVGSKLVFDPVSLMPVEYSSLRGTIEPHIAIIHITRSYWEILVSFQRGFYHILSRPSEVRHGAMHRALVRTTEAFKMLPDGGRTARACRLGSKESLSLIWTLYRNDLCAIRLSKRHRYLRVRYETICARFPELARFAGSDASAEVLNRIVSSPPTQKLPEFHLKGNWTWVRAYGKVVNMLRAVIFALHDAASLIGRYR